MTIRYHAIATTPLNKKPCLVDSLQRSDLSMDSPATDLMEDFSVTRPLKISDQLPYEHVREILFDTHSDYLLVEDSRHQIVGIIPIEDLMGVRAMIRAQACRQRLQELCARDLMEPVNTLPAVSLSAVRRSIAGNIVATFKHHAANYLLVTNETGDQVLGLFNSRAVSRNLGIKVEGNFQAMSVAEIAQAITGHYPKL
ncbi:MAG: hypothetical protein R3208_18930 [Ketobacteraceae bacterium]|nr:hypothetical protein [Ketobacteraceae bacterium]